MTNLTKSELLRFARDAYNDKPDYSTDQHQGLIPEGFEEVYIDLNKTVINQETGKAERVYDASFKARSYYNKDTNELVVAPAGTNDFIDLVRDDPDHRKRKSE